MSQKLLDDFKTSVPVHAPKVADRISALVLAIADRIADLNGDAVKASDLASTLRLDPDSIGAMVATDPPAPEPAPVAKDAPKDGMQAPADPNVVKVVVVDPATTPAAPAAKA